MDATFRIVLSRLIMLVALACGVIGLAAGVAEREWRMGVTGWFTGGTLLAVLALVVLADEYFGAKQQKDG